MIRQKEAVALWNIFKHEKDLHGQSCLNSVTWATKMTVNLNLHHEFNPSSTKMCHEHARTLLDYIKSINNPFSTVIRFHNISTGADIPRRFLTDYLNACKLVRRVIKSLLRPDFGIMRNYYMTQYLLTTRLFS